MKADPWKGYFAVRQRLRADALRFFASGASKR